MFNKQQQLVTYLATAAFCYKRSVQFELKAKYNSIDFCLAIWKTKPKVIMFVSCNHINGRHANI